MDAQKLFRQQLMAETLSNYDEAVASARSEIEGLQGLSEYGNNLYTQRKLFSILVSHFGKFVESLYL